nr:hypothetical protein BaRGS_024073 [Batillaria attramentaria]
MGRHERDMAKKGGVSAETVTADGQIPLSTAAAVLLEPKQEPGIVSVIPGDISVIPAGDLSVTASSDITVIASGNVSVGPGGDVSVIPNGEMSLVPGGNVSVIPSSVVPSTDTPVVLPGSDMLSVTPSQLQSLVLSQPECPVEAAPQVTSLASENSSVPSTTLTPGSECIPSSSGSTAEQQSSNDGTLTAAIQRGIPVTIDPTSLTGPVALNQVFVPIYSNTEKGPVIELVPLKTSPVLQPQVSS